jgi:hypothetical protein
LLARNIYLATAAIVAVLSVFYCRIAESNLQGDLDEVLVEEGLTGVAWSLVGSNGEVNLGAVCRWNVACEALGLRRRLYLCDQNGHA